MKVKKIVFIALLVVAVVTATIFRDNGKASASSEPTEQTSEIKTDVPASDTKETNINDVANDDKKDEPEEQAKTQTAEPEEQAKTQTAEPEEQAKTQTTDSEKKKTYEFRFEKDTKLSAPKNHVPFFMLSQYTDSLHEEHSLTYSILNPEGEKVGSVEVLFNWYDGQKTDEQNNPLSAVPTKVQVNYKDKDVFSVELTQDLGLCFVDDLSTWFYGVGVKAGSVDSNYSFQNLQFPLNSACITMKNAETMDILNLCTLDLSGLSEKNAELYGIVGVTKFVISSDGVLLKTVYTKDGSIIEQYVYDENNNLSNVINGDQERTTTYEYDSNNRTSKMTVCEYDGSLAYEIVYDYDEDGRLIRETSTSPTIISLNYISEYDSEGHHIREIMPLGTEDYPHRIIIELNTNGLYTKEIYYYDEDSISYTVEYEYDANGFFKKHIY